MDEEHFRQGIRIERGSYKGVIVTTSPKIKMKVEDDQLYVDFSFNVEYVPPKVEIDLVELKTIVCQCVIDIIEKDMNANRISNSEYSGQE